MILFLGDSFTWGQGLHIEKWLSEGKSVEFCNKYSPPHYHAEQLSYSDDVYRKLKHFPNLVASKLDVPYGAPWTNGGANFENEFIIKNLEKLTLDHAIQLIIIQFTEFGREPEFPWIHKTNKYDLVNTYIERQIAEISKTLSAAETNIPWLGLSWPDEYSNVLKSKWEDNLIPLKYNDTEYDSISELQNKYKKDGLFELTDSFTGINDGHPNSYFHQVIANSIIDAIKKSDIKFTRV